MSIFGKQLNEIKRVLLNDNEVGKKKYYIGFDELWAYLEGWFYNENIYTLESIGGDSPQYKWVDPEEFKKKLIVALKIKVDEKEKEGQK